MFSFFFLSGRQTPSRKMRWLVLLSILGYGVKGICVSLAADPGWAIACLVLQIFGLALSVPACQSFACSVLQSSTAFLVILSMLPSSYKGVPAIGRRCTSPMTSFLPFKSLKHVFILFPLRGYHHATQYNPDEIKALAGASMRLGADAIEVYDKDFAMNERLVRDVKEAGNFPVMTPSAPAR